MFSEKRMSNILIYIYNGDCAGPFPDVCRRTFTPGQGPDIARVLTPRPLPAPQLIKTDKKLKRYHNGTCQISS